MGNSDRMKIPGKMQIDVFAYEIPLNEKLMTCKMAKWVGLQFNLWPKSFFSMLGDFLQVCVIK